MPKIVGLINLEIPFQRRESSTVTERVAHVGFDTDGQAWGLVTRMSLGGGYEKLKYCRWIHVGFDAIPFVINEFVSEMGSWERADQPAGAP